MSSCATTNCASACGGTSSSSSGGGSGSSSGAGGPPGCVDAANGTCYVLGNEDTYQCGGAIDGTLTASCPSAGLVGCCLFNSPSDYQCFYGGNESTDCPNVASLGPNAWVTSLP